MKAVLVLVLLFTAITERAYSQATGPTQQPSVTTGSSEKKICVVGNVTKPSLIQFRTGMTVTQAIRDAGGIPNSRGKEVRVYSRTADGINRTIFVDLDMVKRKPYMDLELQSFDIVVVVSDTKKKIAGPQQNPCFPRPFNTID